MAIWGHFGGLAHESRSADTATHGGETRAWGDPRGASRRGDNNYDMLFECPEQIVEYAEAFLPQARRAKVTGRQPKLSLPILSAVPESVRSA
ncbi:MAG: hypothetical protein FJ167_03770 [Gammaproteobacteria bacterium]|nr:hypothetical protein [Gammaproteobacteria bacterium]